jgi:hypothetical protein
MLQLLGLSLLVQLLLVPQLLLLVEVSHKSLMSLLRLEGSLVLGVLDLQGVGLRFGHGDLILVLIHRHVLAGKGNPGVDAGHWGSILEGLLIGHWVGVEPSECIEDTFVSLLLLINLKQSLLSLLLKLLSKYSTLLLLEGSLVLGVLDLEGMGLLLGHGELLLVVIDGHDVVVGH